MSGTVYVVGGSFNPPGVHHVRIVETIAERTTDNDLIVVMPCGGRPDKQTTNDVASHHRAAMADLAFGHIRHVIVELEDLEQQTFTRTIDLDSRLKTRFPDKTIVHVVGADLIHRGDFQLSEIQTKWHRGHELWKSANFLVVPRSGYSMSEDDLPPHATVLPPTVTGSSSEIRRRIFEHQSYSTLVPAMVEQYIIRHGLYTGRIARNPTLFCEPLRPFVVADEQRENARQLGARIAELFQVKYGDHNCILVIGGDGFMLHTIRRLWRDHVPFLGLNRGTKGFLLNNFDETTIADKLRACRELKTYTESLLYVEAESVTGEQTSMLAFNDAWVDRLSGQTIWVNVFANDEVKFNPIMGDVMLVSTAAGSTGYAYRMGGARLIPGTQMLQLVGSCITSHHWKNEPLPIETRIRFEAVNREKRPMRGFCDGVPLGELMSMSIRTSSIAAAELAYFPETDLQRRISEL